MQCITRERPRIGRIACPWLIRNFVDPADTFFFVPAEQVLAKAAALGAIPYDIAGVEYTHAGERCTFDYILQKRQPTEPAPYQLACIGPEVDTDRFDPAPQAAELWTSRVPTERHTWNPI